MFDLFPAIKYNPYLIPTMTACLVVLVAFYKGGRGLVTALALVFVTVAIGYAYYEVYTSRYPMAYSGNPGWDLPYAVRDTWPLFIAYWFLLIGAVPTAVFNIVLLCIRLVERDY